MGYRRYVTPERLSEDMHVDNHCVMLARSRWTTSIQEDNSCREWAFSQVTQVRQTGGFSVREKEGNPH